MPQTVSYHAEFGRPARPAINVKLHAPGVALRSAAVDAALDEDAADAIHGRAYDVVVSRFWNDATEKAESLGLGPIEQEGRSGGWLVLTDGRDPLDDPGDDDGVSDSVAVTEWLAAYAVLAAWCEEQLRTAPARVAALAQQYAMDRLGQPAALRLFGEAAGS